MSERRGRPDSLGAVEAGEVLGLAPTVVVALADAGYVHPSDGPPGDPRFALGDLKAFQARVVEGATVGPAWPLSVEDGAFDASELVAALEGRAVEIGNRALALLATLLPEAAGYDDAQRARFLTEAVDRIEAIIALCARGPQGGEPIELDLAEIGADAAHAGVALPGVLLALRLSRDVVVQTAIEISEARGRHWGLALSVVLNRVLPAIDRLADAAARGYWEAVLEIEAESLERYRNVVEQATDGVFELDESGVVRYGNRAFGALLGLRTDALVGFPIPALLGPFELGAAESEVRVRRDDGAELTLLLRQFERVREGVVVGWDAVARDVTGDPTRARPRPDA
ncbi:MAG: PAS domain S-box protein, partial [Acidimicrobiia bacterium]|nr:PAS domain S-box protein [Acidimicrobiia bacterium]